MLGLSFSILVGPLQSWARDAGTDNLLAQLIKNWAGIVEAGRELAFTGEGTEECTFS